ALPAGVLSRGFVAGFVVFASAIFVLAAWQLNPLALALSPVAPAIVLAYSYTKRFTEWSHVVLGVALGIAPAAAWIAVRATLDPRILLLSGAIVFWVAGFDVLYSCQDYEFDRASELYSMPKAFGIGAALWLARVFHLVMIALLATFLVAFQLGVWAMAGVVVVAALLGWEHSLVAEDDLTRLNAAFFTMNGVISVIFFVFVAT